MTVETVSTEQVLAEVQEAVGGEVPQVKKVRVAKHDPEGGQLLEKPKKEKKPKEPKLYAQLNEDGSPQLNEDGTPVMGETKPKKVKVPKEPGERRTAFDKAATITLKVEANPKRAGSAAYERFALYTTGMTVAEALTAGVTSGDLQYDSKHGFIEIDLKIGSEGEAPASE